MAVEAGHLSLFPPQLLSNKQMMMMTTTTTTTMNNQPNGSLYNSHSPMAYGIAHHPLSGTTTTAETLLPMYGSGNFTDSINPGNMRADSGLTYSLPVSRKRSRDSSSINPLLAFVNGQNTANHNQLNAGSPPFTFLGEDISMQIQQQQLEIDQFIAHHTEKVRVDVEERRKRNSTRIIAAVEQGISKRLRAKEEEIAKIAKLNMVLEEKVKSLCVENQIWRELAQTNEATANALRNNLKQVLEQVVQEDFRHRSTTGCIDDAAAAALADDAQSCCESNNEEERMLARNGPEHDSGTDDCTTSNKSSNSNSNRWCRNCGKEESCVLLLPCRHLCLCTLCASSVNICPVCKSAKNISVHVNMS